MRALLAELTSGDDARAENPVPAIVRLGREAIPALLDLTHAEEVDLRCWAYAPWPLRLTCGLNTWYRSSATLPRKCEPLPRWPWVIICTRSVALRELSEIH